MGTLQSRGSSPVLESLLLDTMIDRGTMGDLTVFRRIRRSETLWTDVERVWESHAKADDTCHVNPTPEGIRSVCSVSDPSGRESL